MINKPGDSAEEIYIVWSGRLSMINSQNFENYSQYVQKKKNVSNSFQNSNKDKHANFKKNRKKLNEERAKIMSTFSEGDIFGDCDLFNNNSKIRHFTVKADEDSVVIILNRNDLIFLYEVEPKFEEFIKKSVEAKIRVIKFILDSYNLTKMKKLDLFHEYIKLPDNTLRRNEILAIISNKRDYKFQVEFSEKYSQESRGVILREKKSNINLNKTQIIEKSEILGKLYSYKRISNELKQLYRVCDEIIEESKGCISIDSDDNFDRKHKKQLSNSAHELNPKITLSNFQVKDQPDPFSINLISMTKNSKEKTRITNDIFVNIHKLQQRSKEIFDVIQNYISQFEDYRRKYSTMTQDDIRKSRESIDDTFSMLFEVTEILNKLDVKSYKKTLETYLKATTGIISSMESKIKKYLNK